MKFKQGTHEPFVITFTDLIYGATLGAGLSLLAAALDEFSAVGVVLVLFSFVVLIYDWYGEHFMTVGQPIGGITIVFDAAAMMIFFLCFYWGADASVFFPLALVGIGIRGLAYDIYCLWKFELDHEQRITIQAWTFYAAAFIVANLAFFCVVSLLADRKLTLSCSVALIAIWVLLSVLCEILIRFLKRSSSAKGRRLSRAEQMKQAPASVPVRSLLREKADIETDLRLFYDIMAEDYDSYYHGADADPLLAHDVERIWSIIRSPARQAHQVLEVGCGTGFWLDRIRLINKAALLVGVDLSLEMCRQARKKGLRLISVGDAQSLPFRSCSFDLTISPFDPISHCPNYRAAIGEIVRVTKWGGRIIISVDNATRLVKTYWKLKTEDISDLGTDPRAGDLWALSVRGRTLRIYSHFFRKESLQSLFNELGCACQILGVSTLPSLIPHRIRVAYRPAVQRLVHLLQPVEQFFEGRCPQYASHLVACAKKVGR